MVAFQKATRTKKKLRAAFLGPAGAGKTRTALEVASGIGGRIALIDTEHGSASMYAHLVNFDALELQSFSPDRYVEAINAAEAAGYDVLVIDSLSHAWSGKGGVLEFVDRAKKNGNSFNAWGDATPMQNKLVERLLTCRLHLIVTMRTKMEFVQEKDERTGKTTVRKIGMQPVQRDGVEYEFDVICDIDQAHTLTVAKTRIDEIDGEVIDRAGEPFGRRLRAWLDGGAPARLAPVVPASTKMERDAVLEGPLPDERPAPKPAAPSSEQRLAKALEWAMKHLAKVRIAGAVPADADDDAKKGAQEAVRTARDEDDKGYRALEGVDKRLFCAVRAIADEIEARTLGIDYQRNNDEAEAIAWFTKATSAT